MCFARLHAAGKTTYLLIIYYISLNYSTKYTLFPPIASEFFDFFTTIWVVCFFAQANGAFVQYGPFYPDAIAPTGARVFNMQVSYTLCRGLKTFHMLKTPLKELKTPATTPFSRLNSTLST